MRAVMPRPGSSSPAYLCQPLVSGVDALERLFQLGVGPDGDAEHLPATRPLNLSTMAFVCGE
jgi:hypothetical protein